MSGTASDWQLDRQAVRAGASGVPGVRGAVLAGCPLGGRQPRRLRARPILLTLGALAGFVLGAGVAAWTQRNGLPLVHGARHRLGTYLVAQAAFIVSAWSPAARCDWYAALFNITPVLFAGVIGGVLGMLLQTRGSSEHPQGLTGSRSDETDEEVRDERARDRHRHHRCSRSGDAWRRHRSTTCSTGDLPPSIPVPGPGRVRPVQLADAAIELAELALAAARRSAYLLVGVSTQRASTVVWDRATGEPVGPSIGWQDLRTVFACITAKAEHGLALAPNQIGHEGRCAARPVRPRSTSETCASAPSTPGWRGG